MWCVVVCFYKHFLAGERVVDSRCVLFACVLVWWFVWEWGVVSRDGDSLERLGSV